MMAATGRPAGVAVSIPSRNARNVIRRSPRSAIVRVTRRRIAEPVDRSDHEGVTRPGIVEHGCQTWTSRISRAGELVGEHTTWIDPRGG